jgi:hypothetical protein
MGLDSFWWIAWEALLDEFFESEVLMRGIRTGVRCLNEFRNADGIAISSRLKDFGDSEALGLAQRFLLNWRYST